MTRIGRVAAANRVGSVLFNNGALYVGYSNTPPDADMYLAGSGHSLPTPVGTITFGQGSGGGVCINKAFIVSAECNYLFAGTCSDPGYVNYFDLGDGQTLPTYEDALLFPEDYVLVGAVE